jgi:Tol biopolymer transport system component
VSKPLWKWSFFLGLLAAVFACGPQAPIPTETVPSATPALTLTPTPTSVPAQHGQIAYGSSTFTGDSQVVVMDLETGTVTSLTAGFEGEYYRPVWSPNGQRLAMREEISMQGGGIAVMDVRLKDGRPVGSPPVELFHGFGDGPTWSPDGRRVAFVSTHETGQWTAYTVDLLGSAPERIPGIPPHATDLAWSPDGNWIAFTNYDNPSEQIDDIFIIHPDGTGLTRLTDTPDFDEQGPAWSPDSRQIAFAKRSRSEGVGQYDIYRMHADGSGVAQVTSDPSSEFDPAWSTDGTQIAFTSTRYDLGDGNYEIYVINVDGTGELRLTNNRTTDRWPSWRATPQGTSYGTCSPAAQFVADVTIPAGTQFADVPQEFTKVWRIRNAGNCSWPPAGYGLRFGSGEMMNGPAFLPIPGAIQPGDTADLAVTLTSPAEAGTHSGIWVLFDNAGLAVQKPDGNPLTLPVSIDVLPSDAVPLPSTLYFISDQSGSNQIWRMETDGTTLIQITNEPGDVAGYDVSPTDGSLVYVSRNQLFLTDRDGADRRMIVDFGSGRGGTPVWSADGARLAYSFNGIQLYEPDTGQDWLLTANQTGGSAGSVAVYSPVAWSPDGTQLLVTIGYYEGAELGIISTADGSILARGPLTGMSAWRIDSQAVYLASASYAMMVGMDPGLQLLSAAGGASALLPDAFVWWPFQQPDGSLDYFVSRPADRNVTEYLVQMVQSEADGSGEARLRDPLLLLDTRDTFTAVWSANGEAVAARIVRPAAGAREVLMIPAEDAPPMFLMRDAGQFHWEN